MEEQTEDIQKSIEKLEQYKEAWAEVSSAYQEQQDAMLAEQILGADWENKILDCRLDTLEAFKNQYIQMQQEMADAAWRSANEQIKAAKEAAKGANGTLGGAGDVGGGDKTGDDDGKSERYELIYEGNPSDKNNYKTNDLKKIKEKLKSLNDNIDDEDEPNYYILDHTDKKLINYSKKRKEFYTYAKGTKNAKPGISLVGEEGIETLIDTKGNVSLVTKPSLINMKGGERVEDNATTTKMLKNGITLTPIPMSSAYDELINNIKTSYHPELPYVNSIKKNVAPANINASTNISIGDIHLHEVQNPDGLAKAIINTLPNKMIQEIYRRR